MRSYWLRLWTTRTLSEGGIWYMGAQGRYMTGLLHVLMDMMMANSHGLCKAKGQARTTPQWC